METHSFAIGQASSLVGVLEWRHSDGMKASSPVSIMRLEARPLQVIMYHIDTRVRHEGSLGKGSSQGLSGHHKA